MGADASKFDSKQMPDYFIENPEVSFESTMFLERSLRSVVKGEPSEDAILPFTKFFTMFFDRFYTVFETLSSGPHGFEERDLEDKSMFLIVILKFIVKSPMYMLLARKNGKWQTTERRRLKKFVALYKDLSCEAYDAIGQAIFHAISECDVLYSKWVHTAWIEAYSIFLSQIATIVFKGPKFMKKRRSVYEENDESLDWSDDHFSDFSPDSSAPLSPAGSEDEFFSSSSCSSSGRSSPSLSPSPQTRKPKNAHNRNPLAVRLAKLKVKRKIKRQPRKELVQMALESTTTETTHARNKSKSRSSRRNSWSAERRPLPPNSAVPPPMTFSNAPFQREETNRGIVEQILVASANDSSLKSLTRSSRAISSADRLQADRRQAKRRFKKGFRLEKTRTSYGGRQDFEEEEEDSFHLFVHEQAPRRYSSSLSRSRGISF